MSFQDKVWSLGHALLEKTISGSIRWAETAEEDSFRAILNTGLVRIERYEDPRDRLGTNITPSHQGLPFRLPSSYKTFEGFIYCLVVLDDRNKELARYIPDIEAHAVGLRNLWELAKRGAQNSEQKIDDILNELAGTQA